MTMSSPRIAFGATPQGGRHWQPGKAGSAVPWVGGSSLLLLYVF